MKKLITALSIIAFAATAQAQDTKIAPKALPAAAQSFVKAHFPGAKIIDAERDGGRTVSYDVKLDNRVDLEFDAKGRIKEIDGESRLPNSVIPAAIRGYVMKNYPGRSITDWESGSTRQSVKLDNGTELEFSKAGKFLRIDD